jgi:Mn2+/Fe2+ NRAMP family transporter
MTGTVPVPAPPIPRNFVEYVRSFGPGIVIVLTWLGAGDVVDMSTAGANYGYSLLWVLAANSAQVVLLPMLAGGLWWITASERLIGPDYRNRWWENAVMAILFVLATYFAIQATRDLVSSA